MSKNFQSKHSANISNIYNSIKNSKKIIFSDIKLKPKPKSIPKNIKNKQSSKNKKENTIIKNNINKIDRDYKTSEKEKEYENDNIIVSNFIDSLFDETPFHQTVNNKQKQEKINLNKINDIKIRDKNSLKSIKILNNTEGRINSNKNKKMNKDIYIESEIIFNNFQKKIKISKKKYIYEERLKYITLQISLLQKEKDKLIKELSLLKLQENNLNDKFREKILKKKEKEKYKEMSNNKIDLNMELNNLKLDNDPENLIKFLNDNADNNGGLFPFDFEEKDQKNENEKMRISKSNIGDKRKTDKRTKKNNNLNINEFGNFRLNGFNSKRKKNKFLNKIQLKTEPNRMYKFNAFLKDNK